MSRLAFLFPGQGSQKVGMGENFFTCSNRAREIFERADEALGFKISKLCFEGPEEELQLTRNTQPAILIVSYIAYSLLEKEPVVAAGHSLGEYSALVASGSLSFDDAVVLVHKRAKYMQEAVPVGRGAMAALLGSDYDSVRKGLEKVNAGIVEIANWNSRDQIVISGDGDAVKEALSLINPPRSIILSVSAPFHCSLMKNARDKLSYDLDQVKFKDLKFPVITNVDAKFIYKGSDARKALKRQVTNPVLWYKSMEILKKENLDYCVEMGTGKVLSGLLKKISRKWESVPGILSIQDAQSLEKIHKLIQSNAS